MGRYAKTAVGERLTYRPPDLEKYVGEQFCLRITPEDVDLERCFFVYLDERFEGRSIRSLFHDYIVAPGPVREAEMASWLEPWLRLDPMLPKKLMLLRQMFARTFAHSGQVLYSINHGPGPINPDDPVGDHLGTSVFADGSFDDKILDVVLEFHAEGLSLPELEQWRNFHRIDTAGAIGPTSRAQRRRFLVRLGMALVALVTLPLLFFSCQQEQGANGGNGFGGGML